MIGYTRPQRAWPRGLAGEYARAPKGLRDEASGRLRRAALDDDETRRASAAETAV